MIAQDLPNPHPDATLAELAALGMRAARVVVAMMEIEQAVAEAVACRLPETGVVPGSLAEAAQAGRDVDGAAEVLATAVPRVEVLARAFDRVSRSVRRSVALRRRIEAGWPRGAGSDDRQAMVRRQVGRGVAAVIRREAEGEAAERLFDELAERLDDPEVAEDLCSLPVEEVVRRVCRELGLAMEVVAGVAGVVDGGLPTVDSC